ncbi:MAG: helix-turn-helix transcriptional regulator, partial [Rickettsiales bacterium]|nr:helix-turn-helix transcriptional regulator [Rickettsiales bacterium]
MSKSKDCTLGSEPVVHDFNTFVGEKLRALRNLRNLTRLNLSEILGVSSSLIQQYENGSVRMPLYSVFVLSTS